MASSRGEPAYLASSASVVSRVLPGIQQRSLAIISARGKQSAFKTAAPTTFTMTARARPVGALAWQPAGAAIARESSVNYLVEQDARHPPFAVRAETPSTSALSSSDILAKNRISTTLALAASYTCSYFRRMILARITSQYGDVFFGPKTPATTPQRASR